MSNKEILTIKNANAICAIMIDKEIIDNSVMKLLSFVTNTNVDTLNNKDLIGLKSNGLNIDYIVSTGVFNSVSLTRLSEEK